jgi:hypothetical protein
MKYIFFIAVLCFFAVLFIIPVKEEKATEVDQIDQSFKVYPSNNRLKTVVYDSCEYIIYWHDNGYSGTLSMVHKGNCSNPTHK